MYGDAESTRLLTNDGSSITNVPYKDMTRPQKWRYAFKEGIQPVIAEFIGQLILAFFHCSAAYSISTETTALRSIVPALSDGLTVAILVIIIGGISGAHVNFSVTVAVFLGGGIKLWKVPLYLVAQILGSLSGAALSYAIHSVPSGAFGLGDAISQWQGLGMEIMTSAFLALAVLVSAVELSSVNAAFAIGFTILIDIIAGFPISGGCMNPTLSLGPAVLSGQWGSYWIYWVGPLLGAIVAAGIFRIFLGDKYRLVCSDEHVD